MSKPKQRSNVADSGRSEQAEDGVQLDPETQQTDDTLREAPFGRACAPQPVVFLR